MSNEKKLWLDALNENENLRAEIERLHKLVAEASEILEGDGEYPRTARRFRAALEQIGPNAQYGEQAIDYGPLPSGLDKR